MLIYSEKATKKLKKNPNLFDFPLPSTSYSCLKVPWRTIQHKTYLIGKSFIPISITPNIRMGFPFVKITIFSKGSPFKLLLQFLNQTEETPFPNIWQARHMQVLITTEKCNKICLNSFLFQFYPLGSIVQMDYILTLFFQVLLLLLLMMLTSIITWMRLEMFCQICLNGLLFLNGEWISNVARALTLGIYM